MRKRKLSSLHEFREIRKCYLLNFTGSISNWKKYDSLLCERVCVYASEWWYAKLFLTILWTWVCDFVHRICVFSTFLCCWNHQSFINSTNNTVLLYWLHRKQVVAVAPPPRAAQLQHLCLPYMCFILCVNFDPN